MSNIMEAGGKCFAKEGYIFATKEGAPLSATIYLGINDSLDNYIEIPDPNPAEEEEAQ